MNNFGVMFHHFHDEKEHIVSQGSISGNDLADMICHLRKDYEIIDADIFLDKAINGKLAPNQICLTFDDALACQYDVAYPVIKELGIKAFWFIYTSVFTGTPEKLEVYRHFRFKCFDTIDVFYDAFFDAVLSGQDSISDDGGGGRSGNGGDSDSSDNDSDSSGGDSSIEEKIKNFDPASFKPLSPFYTDRDKLFRYLRDCVLGEKKYNSVMDKMIEAHGYNISKNEHLLWIKEKQLLELYKNGHVVGLHSHSHSTTMSEKSYDDQLADYTENKRVLESLIKSGVISISYPCNSFNEDTDKVMRKLGIQLGFNATMPIAGEQHSNLHFPRKNHTYIMKEMAGECARAVAGMLCPQ